MSDEWRDEASRLSVENGDLSSTVDRQTGELKVLQAELARMSEALAYYEHMAAEDKVRIAALQAELKETQAGYIRMTDARDEARAELAEAKETIEQWNINDRKHWDWIHKLHAVIDELQRQGCPH